MIVPARICSSRSAATTDGKHMQRQRKDHTHESPALVLTTSSHFAIGSRTLITPLLSPTLAPQKRPKTQKDWGFVQYYATDIAVAGVAISLPGTGQFDTTWVQNPEWQTRARMLTALGMQALNAAKARNQARIRETGDELVRLCNDCHMQFKPEIPSQGIIMHSEYYSPALYGKPNEAVINQGALSLGSDS